MSKKIILPVLGIVVGLMILVVVSLAVINKNRDLLPQKTTNKTEATKNGRTDYSAVARKTLDWIDQQRNDDGWYILERGCNFEAKTCDTVWDNQEGNKDGLIATWARFNYYQQTKNAKDLAIIKSDINKFYEKYPNGVDNALWICKITYDMWKSDVFDQTTKDKLKNICFKSDSNFSKVISDEKGYRKIFTSQLNDGRQTSPVWKTWQGYSFVIRGVDSYFGLTSDLLGQYLWTKDNSKLELAKNYFESGKKIIAEQSDSVRAEDDCLLGLSAIDLYEYGGKDETYLNYVKEKYLAFSDENSDVKKYRTAICGLMTKRLYQINENEVFLDGLERNNKVLTGSLLDGGDSVVNKTNDYGFFVSSNGGFNSPFKNTVENGLVVELIRD